MTVTGFEDAFFFFLNKQLSLCVTKKTPHISIAFLKDTTLFRRKLNFLKKRHRKKYLTLNIHPNPYLVSKW
jgi:hypothetical protein